MTEEFISFQEVRNIVARNFWQVTFVFVLCAVLSFVALQKLPRKYKSKGVLNIQASYFQNALVGDLFPNVSDAAEQNAQRMSLLRFALNERFVDDLGEKYGIYKYGSGHPLRVMEREGLMKNIEYFSLSPTTFQISVIARDPRVSYEMTKAVLSQMIRTLIDERRNNLIRIKGAVQTHVQSLSDALNEVSSPSGRLRPSQLKSELERLQENIKAMKTQYTEAHPDIQAMEEKAQAIRLALRKSADQERTVQTLISPASKNATQEVYDELVKKLNYLNVVYQMEGEGDNAPYLAIIEQPTIPSVPFSPPRAMVILVGVAGAVLLSGILVVYSELQRGTFLAPARAAENLGVPLLGELPKLISRKKVRLIEGPQPAAVRHSLPPPAAKNQ